MHLNIFFEIVRKEDRKYYVHKMGVVPDFRGLFNVRYAILKARK